MNKVQQRTRRSALHLLGAATAGGAVAMSRFGLAGMAQESNGPDSAVFGEFVGAVPTGAVLGGAGGIVWAGNAPEPTIGSLLVAATPLLLKRRARVAA